MFPGNKWNISRKGQAMV
jgi:hypothetical protein